MLLAIVAVWTVAHIADLLYQWYDVPQAVDVIMSIVTGGAFGLQLVDEALRRRGGGDK